MAEEKPAAPPPAPNAWTEEKVRALALHSADIVSLLDDQGRLLYNSPAAERISGFSPAELAGLDTFQLIHPDDRAAVGEAFQRALAAPGAVATVQYRYRTKAGGWTWMEAVASNQLDNPDVRGVVTNSRDVGERKQAEAEHARLRAHLAHRQRLESLGTLAGGIAHDFNNMLSALSGHLELAELATAEPAVREELAAAREALDRATGLTRQLLGIARRQAVQPVVFDPGEALQRLRPLLERLLGGRIQVDLALPSPPLSVRMDPAQLEQVVVNLATNARDAMPEGGQLRLDLDRAAAEPGEPEGEVARLRVRDGGPGIPPEVLERAFEPFFTTKEVGRGTGLGLAVSLGIVTQAGGTLRLESRPGEGTTATVRLPLVPAPAPAPAAAAPAAAAPGTALARPGERLLLADDEALVRSTTRRLLERLGWQVDEARDGQEAVDLVAAAPRAYAAALLDVRMPRLGGPEAARRLAALAPGLPVLLITGFADRLDGLEGVLQKPFRGSVLGDRVRALIDGRPAAPAR